MEKEISRKGEYKNIYKNRDDKTCYVSNKENGYKQGSSSSIFNKWNKQSTVVENKYPIIIKNDTSISNSNNINISYKNTGIYKQIITPTNTNTNICRGPVVNNKPNTILNKETHDPRTNINRNSQHILDSSNRTNQDRRTILNPSKILDFTNRINQDRRTILNPTPPILDNLNRNNQDRRRIINPSPIQNQNQNPMIRSSSSSIRIVRTNTERYSYTY